MAPRPRAARPAGTSRLALVLVAVVLVNCVCVYNLMAVHGLIHTAPLLTSRNLELERSGQQTEDGDDWDVLEDMLAAVERAAPTGTLPAESLSDETEGLVEPLERLDVTLVTQTSPERAWMLTHLVGRWSGRISLALFLPEHFKTSLVAPLRAVQHTVNRVTVSEERGKASDPYPINRLRNLALRQVPATLVRHAHAPRHTRNLEADLCFRLSVVQVRTSHFLLTDIDLWPSTDAYKTILRIGSKLLGRPNATLVLPAFEYHDVAREPTTKPRSKSENEALAAGLPRTAAQLGKCTQRRQEPNCDIFKHLTDTHFTTNYEKWWQSDRPQRISCFHSLRYEPYLVVPLGRGATPYFDERFVGYGKNKIQWIQHLRLLGFTFHVLPKAFVIHCPHEASTARQTWEKFKSKKDRLFQDFIQVHTRNASISTRMCKHVNWEVLHKV